MISMVIVCIGVGIRLIAMRTLRGKFSFALLPQHKLITHGIYKYIRHPSYLGSLFIVLGVSLWQPVGGIVLITFAFFLARSVNEEVILSQNPEYQEYMKRTGRFVPKIRSNHGFIHTTADTGV